MLKAITHNGVFHADDVFAAAILQMAVVYEIVRTRDDLVIKNADIVFDVGGEYDPERGRFDHHQRGGAGARENGVPYAAAGLVWKKYGPELGLGPEVCAEVDRRLIQPIDAVDNGYALYEGGRPTTEGVSHYSLSQVISALNPSWNSDEDADAAFEQAVQIAKTILKAEIDRAIAKSKETKIVQKAIEVSKETDPRVIELPRFCPWQEEVVLGAPEALYVLFENAQGTWMVQTVPPELGSFDKKLPLPEEWAGLRGDALAQVTDVVDAVFCHPGRFICGAESLEGARRLAGLALEKA